MSILRIDLSKVAHLMIFRFLWVDLVLRDLLRQRTPKGMQRCIESTPVGVEAMYDRLLSQMIEDAKDGKQSIGKIAISILLHSDRSVDTTVICGMLDAVLHSQDSPKEMALNTEIVVVECGGFVEAEPSRRYLRFIHQTAREFLKSKTLFQGVTLPAWPQSTVEHDHQSFEPINYDDVRSSLASDTDETASRVSWSSNPFSSASSMSSQSSIFSQLETVTDQFARMFAADENLRSIILESLDKQGLAGFEQVFSNLLRGYSKGLQLIAKAPSEQVAALMAGQQTRVIARETVVRLGYLDNVKLFPWNSKDDETPGKAAVLDHYLQDKDKRLGHHDFKVGGESSKVGQALGRSLDESLPLQRDSPLRVQGDDYWFDDTQADEEKEEIEEDNVEAYVNLQRVKQFLTFSPPFKNLIDNLRQRLQPKLIIPPIDFEDLEPEPPFKPNPRTRWQNIIAMISANMRTFWEYAIRPAIGGEVPLAPGMKRVRWTCVSD